MSVVSTDTGCGEQHTSNSAKLTTKADVSVEHSALDIGIINNLPDFGPQGKAGFLRLKPCDLHLLTSTGRVQSQDPLLVPNGPSIRTTGLQQEVQSSCHVTAAAQHIGEAQERARIFWIEVKRRFVLETRTL